MRLDWFNVSSPYWRIGRRRILIRPWNLFNRRTNDGDHWWGFGLLQIGRRHLFFVGHCGVSLLFIGQTE